MAEAENVNQAWLFAIRQKWPPNVFVSINWRSAPSTTVVDPVVRLSRLRDRMKSFLRRHAPETPPVWIEAREKPRAEGEGVHLAVFVPTGLGACFGESMVKWVARDADWIEPKAVDVRPVGARWWDRRDYMLKGGERSVCERFDCRRFRKPLQGVIYGPRVRVSHSIGPSARKAAAERPRKALLALVQRTAAKLVAW